MTGRNTLDSPAPLFRPCHRVENFHSAPPWRAAEARTLASDTSDVARGALLVLQLLEREEVDANCTTGDGEAIPPLFSAPHRADLLRLATASLALLARQAERLMEQSQEVRP